MEKKVINKLRKDVVFFYIYAFLGWIIDVTIVLVTDGHLENRGFLKEAICPMYGFAALVLIFIANHVRGKGHIFKRLGIAVVWCTVLEYFTAFFLGLFFSKPWWDYSAQPFNFQGRICLAASILWGAISLIFMEVLHPGIKKLVKKISSKVPVKAQNTIIILFLTGTAIDLVFSIIHYLK